MILAGLILIPLLVAGASFLLLQATITWKEFLLQVAVSLVVVVAGFYIAKYNSLSDVEHLNGRITAKLSGDEKCCHCRMVCDGYRTVVNCTGSGQNRSCSTSEECTGYHEECDHFEDYWWSLDSTVGRIPIDDCEPNARRVPQDWALAQVGEPASVPHTFENYLKADPDSLIVHEDHGPFLSKVPDYPRIYGHYKVNPVIGVGVSVPAGWQEAIRDINADFGAKKQVDVAVILTNIQDIKFAEAVEAKWLYGPKNSITVIIGVRGGKATWVGTVTISRVESLKIHLRDQIKGLDVNGLEIPKVIRHGVEHEFHRKPMHDFEYLASTAEPSTGATIALYIIGLLLSIGLAYWSHKKDIFGDENRYHFNRRA